MWPGATPLEWSVDCATGGTKVGTTLDDGLPTVTPSDVDKFHLLIIDDFGLAPLDQSTRRTLLQPLKDRYAKRPTIIASQLPVSKWHENLAAPTLADAIMHHVTTNAQSIKLKGPSLRGKKSKGNLQLCNAMQTHTKLAQYGPEQSDTPPEVTSPH